MATRTSSFSLSITLTNTHIRSLSLSFLRIESTLSPAPRSKDTSREITPKLEIPNNIGQIRAANALSISSLGLSKDNRVAF